MRRCQRRAGLPDHRCLFDGCRFCVLGDADAAQLGLYSPVPSSMPGSFLTPKLTSRPAPEAEKDAHRTRTLRNRSEPASGSSSWRAQLHIEAVPAAGPCRNHQPMYALPCSAHLHDTVSASSSVRNPVAIGDGLFSQRAPPEVLRRAGSRALHLRYSTRTRSCILNDRSRCKVEGRSRQLVLEEGHSRIHPGGATP